MDIQDILQRAVIIMVPLILSLTVHEYAHALAAKILGDDTAEARGRLTLNPLAHIDPVGTLLVPLMLVLSNASFGFGWAKPVPFSPTRFTRKVSLRTGTLIVAAAGPLSNLVMAFLCAVAYSIAAHAGVFAGGDNAFHDLGIQLIFLNIALFIFNLIPVYPLDGQKVLSGILSYNHALAFERFSARYGMFLLIAVFVFGGRIMFYPVLFIFKAMFTVVGLG